MSSRSQSVNLFLRPRPPRPDDGVPRRWQKDARYHAGGYWYRVRPRGPRRRPDDPRLFELDRPMATARGDGFSLLSFQPDRRAADPTSAVHLADVATVLAGVFGPADAAKVVEFIRGANELPATVADRIRGHVTRDQLAAMLGLVDRRSIAGSN